MVKDNILITGGSGYIGSVLTDHFLKKNCKVTVLDNLRYNQKSLFPYCNNPDFSFIYGDVRNENLVKKTIENQDVIIPLAALVGAPLCDLLPKDARTINTDSVMMINRLRDDDQKLIFPTTNSGYGTKTGEVYCTEKTPLEPISLYGKVKCDAENHLLENEKPAITLRLATAFGISPRMRTDLLVNDFVLKAVRDNYVVLYQAHFKRNYIHIKDIARAFEHCKDNYDSMKNEPYNVGLSSANLSKLELAEKIKEYVPKFTIICDEIGEDIDKRNYIVSNKKIEKTGFSPEYSLDFGINELIKGYEILFKKNPYGNV